MKSTLSVLILAGVVQRRHFSIDMKRRQVDSAVFGNPNQFGSFAISEARIRGGPVDDGAFTPVPRFDPFYGHMTCVMRTEKSPKYAEYVCEKFILEPFSGL